LVGMLPKSSDGYNVSISVRGQNSTCFAAGAYRVTLNAITSQTVGSLTTSN
jgi:hypothetical protein